MPTPQIHRQIKDLAADYEHVVIDTPPGEMSITRSAILAVPLVLVPLSPTGLDIDRLRPTWEALADLEPTHPLGLAVGVLLTKVRRGTRQPPGGPRRADRAGIPGDGDRDPAGGVAVRGELRDLAD